VKPATEAWAFPLERLDPSHPPARYVSGQARLPRRVPLAYGGDAWLVTGYADSRRVLGDPAFSSDPTRPGYPSFPLAPRERVAGHFLSMDPPEHTRLRRIVAPVFSISPLRSMEPFITTLADRLVAGADQHPTFDLVSHVSVPLHGGTLAELLGVPAADQRLFQDCTRQLQRHSASAATRLAASARLARYLTGVLASPDAPTRDNLLGRLARSRDGGEITPAEAVSMASLILVAGMETTVALLALTVLALVRDGRQWDLVAGHPERWAGPAVQEALRYWTVVQHGVARVATRDAELSGQRISAGDAVVVHLPTANRDPRVYARADAFDITRDAHQHVAFGHGLHRCLGASLAQIEVTAAVRSLARQAPRLALARPEPDIFYLHHMLVYGLRELHLTSRAGQPGGDNG
jgi:cytochrome P450 monooxygenase